MSCPIKTLHHVVSSHLLMIHMGELKDCIKSHLNAAVSANVYVFSLTTRSPRCNRSFLHVYDSTLSAYSVEKYCSILVCVNCVTVNSFCLGNVLPLLLKPARTGVCSLTSSCSPPIQLSSDATSTALL